MPGPAQELAGFSIPSNPSFSLLGPALKIKDPGPPKAALLNNPQRPSMVIGWPIWSSRTWDFALLTPDRGDLMPRETMELARSAQEIIAELTVIVPAFNEAESIRDTAASLLGQTMPPSRVLVVDDCSTDGTGEVAAGLGVEVLPVLLHVP
jgi:Glycosyl transferase family 2